MSEVFADTSLFFAFLIKGDKHQAQAIHYWRTFSGRIWTTHWVLLELANFFCAMRIRSTIASVVKELKVDPRISIATLDAALFDRGLELYDQRPDKQWSLTDCISFVVMQDHGISEALTTDHHFEQAGFRVLLK